MQLIFMSNFYFFKIKLCNFFHYLTVYRVPNNDNPRSPEKTMHVRKKMKTPTGSPFHSTSFTSLLKSPVDSVPSNDVTNNLKKEGRKKKWT